MATRPIQDQQAATVAKVIQSVFSEELGFPSQVIMDWGSELPAVDTRALLEEIGMKLTFC